MTQKLLSFKLVPLNTSVVMLLQGSQKKIFATIKLKQQKNYKGTTPPSSNLSSAQTSSSSNDILDQQIVSSQDYHPSSDKATGAIPKLPNTQQPSSLPSQTCRTLEQLDSSNSLEKNYSLESNKKYKLKSYK